MRNAYSVLNGYALRIIIAKLQLITVLSLGKIIEFELFPPLLGYFGRVLRNFLPRQGNDLTTWVQNPEQALKTVPKLVKVGSIIQKLRIALAKVQLRITYCVLNVYVTRNTQYEYLLTRPVLPGDKSPGYRTTPRKRGFSSPNSRIKPDSSGAALVAGMFTSRRGQMRE